MTQWIPENDPVLKLLLHTGDLFGSSQPVLNTLKTDNGRAFSRDVLVRLKDLTEELSRNDQIFLASSLSNSPYITKIEGGIEVRDFLKKIPKNQNELIRLKNTAFVFGADYRFDIGAGLYLNVQYLHGFLTRRIIPMRRKTSLDSKRECFSGRSEIIFWPERNTAC